MLQRQLVAGQSSEEVLYGHMHYVEAVKFAQCPSLGLLLVTASWDHDAVSYTHLTLPTILLV